MVLEWKSRIRHTHMLSFYNAGYFWTRFLVLNMSSGWTVWDSPKGFIYLEKFKCGWIRFQSLPCVRTYFWTIGCPPTKSMWGFLHIVHQYNSHINSCIQIRTYILWETGWPLSIESTYIGTANMCFKKNAERQRFEDYFLNSFSFFFGLKVNAREYKFILMSKLRLRKQSKNLIL